MSSIQMALVDDRANILLVEDDQDDILLIKKAFKSILDNFQITVAENGLEGLQMLNENPDKLEFDLIILDINMPVMNGFEFLDKIRAEPKTAKIPVVVLTTTNNQKELDKAYALGANTVIQKDKFFELAPDVAQVLIDYWYRLAHIPGR